jgi:malonyl-CoA O-methyltransferase
MTEQFNSLSNRNGYDQWAACYDSYPNPTIAHDEFHFPKIWSHVKNKNILEIGCGTGRHTQKLLAQENQVTGLDLSSGMLEIAQKRLADKNVKFIESDFMTYGGFLPNSFDAAITSLVLEHIKDIAGLFQKVATVLKPAGEFFISEIHPLKAAAGGRAHFKNDSGEKTFLDSYPHTIEDIENAATKSDFITTSSLDIKGEPSVLIKNPTWEKYQDQLMIKIWGFKKLPQR